MNYAIKHRFGLAALIAGSLLGAACESEELREPVSEVAPSDSAARAEDGLNLAPPAVSPIQRADLEREDAQMRCRETSSPSDLSIRWEHAPETSQSKLTAIVKNNTTASISAEPVLIAANPSLGETRERRLDSVSVAPGAEATLVVNVEDFPMQSLGEATSVSIGLRWKRHEMQEEMASPQALSQPLFVTHDDESFRTAVVREYESERDLQLARASSVKATAQLAGRRLRRAVNLADARKFTVIERADVPALQLAAPQLVETTNIDARQP
jgi:hypothetical protein